MNHPSEWTRYYEPRRGKYMYKHKGTGVISDTLIKLGKKIVKPLGKLAFKTASEKVAKNVGEKVAEVVTKRGSDKIQALLRKRKNKPPVSQKSKVSQSSMQQLNNLLSQKPTKRRVSQRQKVSQKSMHAAPGSAGAQALQQLNNLISRL